MNNRKLDATKVWLMDICSLLLRLKDIEDRVMFLEGVSPEYFPLFSQSSGALGGQTSGVIDTNNPSLSQNQMMPDGTVETAKQVYSLTHPISLPSSFYNGWFPTSKQSYHSQCS